jgi:hypothetical protein
MSYESAIMIVVSHSDSLGKFQNSELITVSDVDGSGVFSIHEENQAINEIVNILEGSRLLAVSINCHVLSLERLYDEVRDDSAIVWVHSRSKGVENTRYSHIDAILTHVTVSEGLSYTFPFVVTSPRADTIDVTPIVFSLGVFLGITVDFGSGSDEEASFGTFRQTEHVECAHERRLNGFHCIVLVVWWRRRTRQMIDF